MDRHLLNPDIKIQKTLPGEGYHVWHCEVGSIPQSRRLLLCMLYLNDVKDFEFAIEEFKKVRSKYPERQVAKKSLFMLAYIYNNYLQRDPN